MLLIGQGEGGARRRRAAVGDTAMVVVAPVPATVAHSDEGFLQKKKTGTFSAFLF